MKIVTDLKKANDLLHCYVGAKCQIAFYSESLRRIAIRVWLPDVEEVVYVIGVGCECINGGFSLSNISLSITHTTNEITKEGTTYIRDRISGFELTTSGGFSVAQGLEQEFGTSFDNFLTNAKL